VSESTHDADNRFLECAEAAGADFLVTGNKRHFPKRWKKTQVVNARELMGMIGPSFLNDPPRCHATRQVSGMSRNHASGVKMTTPRDDRRPGHRPDRVR